MRPKEGTAEAFAPRQLQVEKNVFPPSPITSPGLSLCASRGLKEEETSAAEVCGLIFFSPSYERIEDRLGFKPKTDKYRGT